MYAVGKQTCRDVRVDLHIVVLAIQRRHFHIQVGEHKRLTLQVIRRDGRHERDVHLHGILHVHSKDALGRRILECGLVDRPRSGQAHPSVGRAVNADETTPAGDLITVYTLSVSNATQLH